MVKENLRGYCDRKNEITQLEGMLKEIESRMESPRVQELTGMPSGSTHDNSQLDKLIDKHILLKKRYQEKLIDLLEKQNEVENTISGLAPLEREMFRMRYIQGLKWEDICVRLNYSWRQTHRAHSLALRRLEEKVECSEKHA